jgi:periplasmic divalent cation tolerance protein
LVAISFLANLFTILQSDSLYFTRFFSKNIPQNRKMTAFIEIHITTATEEEAIRIGEILVEARLAACAQISGPIRSIYVWEGKKESTPEWVCCLKSRESLFPELVKAVRKHHSYQCPQIVAVPIQGANEDYLQWMEQAVNSQ